MMVALDMDIGLLDDIKNCGLDWSPAESSLSSWQGSFPHG